jgi:dTDP-4-dehydrorhamnose 3,5-epimerase
MKIASTTIPDVMVIEPAVHGDERGFFFESFNARTFEAATGKRAEFVQDNHSRSTRGVLRGLHYQVRQPQGKLVRVVRGEVFDVVVDLRRGSATFGRHHATILSESNKRMLWVPPGFAHGFLVLSDVTDFLYKTTAYYAPECERTIAWDDATLGIAWPLAGITPILSGKDKMGVAFGVAEVYEGM